MRKILLFSVSCLLAVPAFSQSTPSYCLENNAVHGFLNDFVYTDDYSYTKITDYCDEHPYQYYKSTNRYGTSRKDQPLPVPLRWTAAADVVSQKIELSEDASFSNPVIYSVSKDSSSYDIYNLIPGRKYNYRVLATKSDNSVIQLDSASFNTTGQLRMLKIDGIFNVRDLGGWNAAGGHKMAYGKIFRGSRMSNNGTTSPILTPDGAQAMIAAGIRADLDLRTDSEAPLSQSPLAPLSGQSIDYKRINNAYQSRVSTFDQSNSSIEAVQWIIDELKKNRPVYFHCSVGADRTETVAFFIGALCGMDENSLAKEFELTSFSADSIVTNGNIEDLRRRRTYDGRFDNEEEDYKYAKMIDKVKALPGGNIQRKIYNYLVKGKDVKSISSDDLAWLVKEMTGCTIMTDIECGVDTIRLEMGETYQFNIKIIPEEADYQEIKFKTSSSMVATVTEDGVVTAVNGGKAIVTVDVDGIIKSIPVIVPVTQESVSNLCVENDLVHKFITGVHYDDADYSVSYIEDYANQTVSYIKDWPSAARVEWNYDPELIKQYLIVSSDADFNDVTFETETNIKSNYWDVKNLDPQKFYYYKLNSTYSDMTSIEALSSAFLTTGSVKMIRTDGTYNVRDLGGWTGLDGHMVKYGKILRGARLKNNTAQGGMMIISNEDIDVIREWANAELDLRSDEETNSARSALGARVVKFKRIASANTCLGDKILEGDAYIIGMQTIIDWLKNDIGVYISSTLGADRVGTMAFLINGLLGVSESDLAKDYELSSFSTDTLEQVIRKRSDSQYVGLVTKIKSLEGETLQKKIFNYFKTGVNGKAVSEDDLNWFIEYMIDTNPRITKVSAASKEKVTDHRIFNLFGQEVTDPGKGIYIKDGKKYIVK